MTQKHTPTPWKFEKLHDGHTSVFANTLLAKVYSTAYRDLENEEANAAFIVRAVNSHDALISVVQKFINFPEGVPCPALINEAKAALAKAEGK